MLCFRPEQNTPWGAALRWKERRKLRQCTKHRAREKYRERSVCQVHVAMTCVPDRVGACVSVRRIVARMVDNIMMASSVRRGGAMSKSISFSSSCPSRRSFSRPSPPLVRSPLILFLPRELSAKLCLPKSKQSQWQNTCRTLYLPAPPP